MRDNRGSGKKRYRQLLQRGIGWSIVLVLAVSVLLVVGVAGVLVVDGPDGLADRIEQVTGDQDLADEIGDLFDVMVEDEAPPAQFDDNVTGEWPEHPQDTEVSAIRIEQLIAEKINEIRAERNLTELVPRADVIEVSRNHSKDMYERDYFAHETPDGMTPADRVDEAGVQCSVGENLGKMWYEPMIPDGYEAQGLTSEAEVAEAFVEGWMESDGHRENLLTPEYRTHGVGVYIGEDGEVFATHKFCVEG